MVREILKLKTDNGLGANNPPFKNIEITEYSFKSPLMGIPTLTAELLWPTCLDDEWTHKEYVELRGERYYIRQVQTSEISNDNVVKYKHSLDFKSEREQLLHVYFYDVVPSWSSTYDRPNTNSTKFKFFGIPREFCDRLNCAFRYAGIGDSILETKTSLTDADKPNGDGYCVVLSGYGGYDLEQSQEFEWEDKYLFDALSEGFDKFKIPFCFHGKKIVFNEYVEPIEHVFKYGFDNALLSIKKSNANARIINRITFKGSSENIPYFYPNETEYGHISLTPLPTNKILNAAHLILKKPSRLVGTIPVDVPVVYSSRTDVSMQPEKIEYMALATSYKEASFDAWTKVTLDDADTKYLTVIYRLKFFVEKSGNITITSIPGCSWFRNQARPDDKVGAGAGAMSNLIESEHFKIVKAADLNGDSSAGQGSTDCYSNASVENGKITIKIPTRGTYYLAFRIRWYFPTATAVDKNALFWKVGAITATKDAESQYFWKAGDREFKELAEIGVDLDEEFLSNVVVNSDIVGEGFKWAASGRMPFQTNLMPPKYRDTLGTERFYNALNNTYLKADGKTYYSFKNPYVDGNPNEYIHTDETVKPTIEGVKNSQEELFGVISGIAFDADDNDSLKGDVGSDDKDKNDSANYAHSFFYIRLNKFDGSHGFNLFNSASQTDAMTIQMTSGKCNGCKFKIQVIEEDKLNDKQWRNPVQTKGADGDIIYGTQSQIIDKNNPQEWQQDTTKNYIWIAVQKDAGTFGVIMPNRTHEYFPAVGDTFNIINIDLPQGDITAAEERGMYAMLDFMENNNEEKFNFDITASRIFFAEHPAILALLNENSRIKIEYNGEQYVQYVSEFAIDCKDNEALPDVKLTLSNTLEPSGSFVDEVVAQAVDATNIGKGGRGAGGGLSTELADKRYVRKDKDDRTEHRISSDTAFEVGNFVSGSSGGIMFVDPETGQSTLEVDYFKARIKAIFETLEIAHVRSIGGKLTITPGGSIDISFVEELDGAYRCYFKQQEETEGADCRFIVGDDVICQSFNISNGTHQNASNKYYWRKVTAVSNEGSYVELSKTDCAIGSDVPEIGDTICQLGSDDVSRQSAIILSTVDTFSPNITLYDGVTNFTLTGKEMVDMGVDPTTGKAYFHVYGNAYIGDKDGNSFLKYDNLLKLLEIKAKLQIGTTVGDQTLEEYIQQVSPPVEQEDIEQFVNNIVDPKLEGIQNQIDGVIESFFGFGAPTLDNYPANEWTTDAERAAHERDTYTDKTEYVDDATTPTAGQSWKWQYTSPNDYGWVKIADSDAVKALLDAAKAQDTADGKRRVFTAQPTAQQEYDPGDLWVNATYGTQYNNDILRCITHKEAGAAFNIAHWTLASKYTDDTAAQAAAAAAAAAQTAADNAQNAADAAQTSVTNLSNYVDGAFKDGVISESEAATIAAYINTINANKQAIDGTYTKLYANAYLAASGKAALKTAYNNVSAKITALLNAIDTAIADGAVTDAEKTSVNNAFALFNTAYNSFSTAVETANKSIQDVLKSYAEAAKVAADNAQAAADAAQSDANTANNRLTQWAADGVISPTEKQSIKDEIARIDADKAHITAEYTRYGLGTATAYNNAQAAYRAQLVMLSAATPESITIPADFATNQTTYYNARTTALSAIAAAAKKYAADIAKQEAEKAVADYEYLKKALQDVTTISGGLMLSGLIRLGENNTDPNAQTVWAGHNGIYSTTALGRTIGSWWGGDMLDRFDVNDNRLNVAGKRYATSLVRMDGSAYFADGLVGFRKNGSGWLAGDNIKWDATGTITFGNGIKIDLGGGNSTTLGGIESSLASVLNVINSFSNVLIPVDSSGNKVAWDSANLFAVKSIKGFYSESFISARGVGSSSGGSGGGGTSYSRLDAWTDYTSDKSDWVLSAYLGADLNSRVVAHTTSINSILSRLNTLEGKNYLDALNLVQSGSGNAVTALSLSADKKTLTVTKGTTFLTQHQSLANYVTLNTAQTISAEKEFTASVKVNCNSDSTSFVGYIPFRDANYNGVWGRTPISMEGPDGERFGFFGAVGHGYNVQFIYLGVSADRTKSLRIYPDGKATASKFSIYNGTSSQFLKADGSVDGNSYLTTGTASSTYVKKSGDTMTGNLSVPSISGITSTALVTNLNADLLDGAHADDIRKTALAFKIFTGTSTTGGFDLNTLAPDGGIVSNYGSTLYWANAPADAQYGIALHIRGNGNLGGQFFADINHKSATDVTRKLWWRASGTVNGAKTWGKWHQIAFTDSNVASATKLATARTINGTAFDGTANITTAKWGTARTITIGNTGKSVDGSGNVAWSLAEIGALGATANAVSATKLVDNTAYKAWGQTFFENGRPKSIVGQTLTLFKTSASYTGGWAREVQATDKDDAVLGAFGFLGSGQTLSYAYIGKSYGSPWLVVTPSGNVGIGTTAPAYKLDVNGNAHVSDVLYVGNTVEVNSGVRLIYANNRGYCQLGSSSQKNGTISGWNNVALTQLIVDSETTQFNGSLKIGNITLSYDSANGGLHVSGGGLYADGYVTARGVGSSAEGTGGSVNLLTSWSSYTSSMATSYALSAGLGYDLHARLQNVYTNTTCDGRYGSTLAISGSTLALKSPDGTTLESVTLPNVGIVSSGSGNAVTGITASGTTLTVTKGSTFSLSNHTHSNYGTTLYLSGNTLYLRNGSTNIGSSVTLGSYLPLSGGTMTGKITLPVVMEAVGNANFNINSDANNPNVRLTLNSTNFYIQAYNNATRGLGLYLGPSSSSALLVKESGDVYVASGKKLYVNGAQVTSDARLKNVIGDISLSVEQVANAPAVAFRWRENGERSVGSIAQYWMSILPDTVSEDSFSKKLYLDYSRAALLSAIVTAKRVLSVEERMLTAEEKIKQLEERLSKYENNNILNFNNNEEN